VRVHEPITVLDFLDCQSDRATASASTAPCAPSPSRQRRHRAAAPRQLDAGPARRPAGIRRRAPAAKWDPRLYGIGAQILRDLGVRRMRLLASPRKMPSMAGFDLELTGYLTD
jgi:3,4-dihydroxy 2-butanone 4-phosphate synthase/GTP cyclohydrolase II